MNNLDPSPTCQTWLPGTRTECGAAATLAYPAMGGGYHSMCPRHAEKHLPYCITIEDARLGKKPDFGRSGAAEGGKDG